MANQYDSYNSSYPLAFYEVGTVYAFYGACKLNVEPAKVEYVKKYAQALENLEQSGSAKAIQPVAQRDNSSVQIKGMHRFYAVVVDKEYGHGKSPKIVVMFRNGSDNVSYLMKKYAVDHDCSTNGMDLMPVQSRTNYRTNGTSLGKVGGITRAISSSTNNSIGGITRMATPTQGVSGIGGITRVDRNVNQPDTQTGKAQVPSKVGGITRVNKVGKITRQ